MEAQALNISSNLEDYLETIYHLQGNVQAARAKDIADWLKVTRASVTGALKSLARRGLIHHKPYSTVKLTDQGETIAAEIVRRHRTLKTFFENILQLEPQHAEDNACRVEHAVDTKAMDRLVQFLDFVQNCPRSDSAWLNAMTNPCEGLKDREACIACLSKSAESIKA